MTNHVNIVGNVYDKYRTRNPISRFLMDSFLSSVLSLYERAAPRSVLEVGCGEGSLASYLLENAARPDSMEICDLSLEHVPENIDPFITKREASIYSLPYENKSFDLVLCCEVLEHLDDPGKGISEIARVAKNNVIVSTPREPIWRILNCARAKYLKDLGNTPGHIQHFSKGDLIRLVQQYLSVQETLCPVPWTILLCDFNNQ